MCPRFANGNVDSKGMNMVTGPDIYCYHRVPQITANPQITTVGLFEVL